MNLGAALNPRLDVFEQVEAFAQAGFSYVDFGFDFPLTAETFDAGRFRDALLENGLALHGQTPAHLPFGSPYPTIREQAVAVAQKTLNVLESLGAKTVIVHPDGAFWFQEAF
ncbi:MAG: hypothetical protein Q8P02_01040, partial [Candidatus Micrarchaeota archaeon]|nr:hypothetical protein [Candidatus Micrarchaeota archaeon]